MVVAFLLASDFPTENPRARSTQLSIHITVVRHFETERNRKKMKIYLQLILLSTIFLGFSCKENTTEQKTSKTEKQIELNKTKDLPKDSVIKEIPKHYEHKFVIARSGLNYRDLPKGNVLGKFPLNTQLKIIEYTKIFEQIKDGEKVIKGEWVGVEKDLDTVYVFNGFLSHNHLTSDIKLYLASSYYKEHNGKIRTAFLNLSETYFENTYNENNDREENLILTENNLSKDTIRLNKSQRNKFLKLSNISESDKVFIYSISNGNIETLKVKELPAIACINIYFHGEDYEKSEFDYEFGFDLGKSSYGDFVFIGENNPFQTGKLTSIIWKRIENQNFPKIINDNIQKWWSDNSYKKGNVYKFSNNNLDYFIQEINRNGRLSTRYLFIVENITNEIVSSKLFSDTESTYLIPLRTENSDGHYESQMTGKLFKDKANIMFGFLSHSFGCTSITVIDETEPSIPILCDNRH